jgi:hypothetical protein
MFPERRTSTKRELELGSGGLDGRHRSERAKTLALTTMIPSEARERGAARVGDLVAADGFGFSAAPWRFDCAGHSGGDAFAVAFLSGDGHLRSRTRNGCLKDLPIRKFKDNLTTSSFNSAIVPLIAAARGSFSRAAFSRAIASGF